MSVSDFLTPGSDGSLVSSAETGSGTDIQQAFSSEYNVLGIKTNKVPIFVQAPLGNNAGVTNPVGTSSSQTTAAPIYANGNIQSSSGIGYGSGTGWWIGFDQGVPKFYIGDITSGDSLTWDGTSLSVKGDVSVSDINIPDTTSADSFHVDDMGNSWWGANNATGYTHAPASITSAGAATFQSVQIGGTSQQYVVNNGGIINFGDGSDGSVIMTSGVYILTRDMYYSNLQINNGATLIPSGYRVFCSSALVCNGTIQLPGYPGGNGQNGTNTGTIANGGAGGNAIADGYLKGSLAGGSGGNANTGGNATQPTPGASASNSLGSSGAAGGNSTTFGGSTTAGIAGGTATPSNVKLIANWHLLTLLDISSSGSTVKFNNSGAASGGNSGGYITPGGPQSGGGGGGGGGSSGGIIAIYAKNLTLNPTSLITAIGGQGGNGGNGASYNSGCGGGGGGGGAGGIVILVYNVITNNGTITLSGGAGGTGGSGSAGGAGGGTGGTGASGVVYEFAVSL